MPNTLGEKVQYHRKKEGLSLDKLADLSGSSKSYIWELENPRPGKKPLNPSAEKLAKIAEHLLVTPDYLLNNSLGGSDENLTGVRKEAFFRKYEKLDPKDQNRIDEMIELWGK